MPDTSSASETRPLISPSAQSQPRPLTTVVDKRKQDKSVLKSSLDIVFSYSRSQQLFFGSHLPSAPSFVADDTDPGGNDSSYYYFNPHIEAGSARKRRSRAQADRRRRRRAAERGEDVEGGAGLRDEDDDGEDDDEMESTVDEDDIAEEDESMVDDDQDEDQDEDVDPRGRREDKQPRNGNLTGLKKNPPRPRLLDHDSNDHDIFRADHSPSPSRPSSPGHTRRTEGYGTIQPGVNAEKRAASALIAGGAGGKGKGKAGGMRRWDSERTITSGNAFDESTKDYRGWSAADPKGGAEVGDMASEISLNEDTEEEDDEMEGEQQKSEVQPLRKASVISLRLPTEFSRGFPGGGLTPLSPGSTGQESQQPTSSTPLNKPRRASNISALSTPVRRDARQGSFASYNNRAGMRRGSMTLSLSPGAQQHQDHLHSRKMSVGVKDIKGRQVEVGRSTSGQTMFNAIAVLVGIGVLSEPLAFAYAGWIGGTCLLVFFGFVTNYTAKLLAHIIMSDPDCQGYSDLGIKAFGWKARLWVDVLFCCELFALAIAWIVLLGDSLEALLGHFSSDGWKIVGFFIVAPTTLLPLHLLSIPSLISLFSSLLLIVILLIDGFTKHSAPGSILHPVHTSLGPSMENYNFLGGLGLLIAGFGGHAIIPSLAIDMKSPEKFDRVVNWAFGIASVIFAISGTAGYLMFGDNVSDAIMKDLLLPQYGFSIPLNQVATWMIVINPIAKFALCCRPLNLTVETMLGLNSVPPPPPTSDHKNKNTLEDEQDPMESCYTITTGAFPVQVISEDAPSDYVKSEKRKTWGRVAARAGVTAACVVVAIALPGFGRLMAFLGSFTTFCICVLLPIAFYTAIVPKEERGGLRDSIHLVIFLISLVMCIAGTGWAFVTGSTA